MTGHVLALGGGGWASDPRDRALDDYALGLARRSRPRVCLLPTASGDADWLIARFYEAFDGGACAPSHLPLFRPHPAPAAERLRDQDVVYVTGGSTANMLAVWEVHGVAAALREAWARGGVMAGVSAGAICWFEAGLSNSLGPGWAPVRGIGLAPGGFCPHADSDPGRLGALRDLVERGAMPPTLAVDDGCAVHLAPGAPARAVAALPGRGARWVGPGGAEDALRVERV